MAVPATTGQLRTSINDMEIGDYIRFNYSANKISGGYIDSLNVDSNYPSETLSGYLNNTATKAFAYFVKVDKGLLLADRVIVHSVTWDLLNSNKLIQGLPTVIDNINGKVRSLTGGVAYVDANGNLSITDKGFGAFPINNEWDRYIVNFPTDKIQSGKTLDDVFHWSNSGTLTQDTLSIQLVANTNRARRGLSAINTLTLNTSSNSTLANTGFRPVFKYKE